MDWMSDVGGGSATIRQYFQAGLIDQLHLAISPVVLGSGERPPWWDGPFEVGIQITEYATSSRFCMWCYKVKRFCARCGSK
jgi:riboflavin biosynthesis pyrimidine reductase